MSNTAPAASVNQKLTLARVLIAMHENNAGVQSIALLAGAMNHLVDAAGAYLLELTAHAKSNGITSQSLPLELSTLAEQATDNWQLPEIRQLIEAAKHRQSWLWQLIQWQRLATANVYQLADSSKLTLTDITELSSAINASEPASLPELSLAVIQKILDDFDVFINQQRGHMLEY